MMRTRFRRRRKAQWLYANSETISLNSLSFVLGAQPVAHTWLFPPGRTQFLLNTRGRDRLTYVASHLWLDFYWRASSTGSFPDVDLCAFKTTISDPVAETPDLSPILGMWDQPSTPNSLSSWEDDDDDGTNSFMWSHHIKGISGPNASFTSRDAGFKGNQGPNIPDADSDHVAFICRKYHVTQEWQPDVVVRSKRRCVKGDGIVLAMTSPVAVAAQIDAFLEVRSRTLIAL